MSVMRLSVIRLRFLHRNPFATLPLPQKIPTSSLRFETLLVLVDEQDIVLVVPTDAPTAQILSPTQTPITTQTQDSLSGVIGDNEDNPEDLIVSVIRGGRGFDSGYQSRDGVISDYGCLSRVNTPSNSGWKTLLEKSPKNNLSSKSVAQMVLPGRLSPDTQTACKSEILSCLR